MLVFQAVLLLHTCSGFDKNKAYAIAESELNTGFQFYFGIKETMVTIQKGWIKIRLIEGGMKHSAFKYIHLCLCILSFWVVSQL